MIVDKPAKAKPKTRKRPSLVHKPHFARIIMISQKKEHTVYYRNAAGTTWDISGLEAFFAGCHLPEIVRLNDCSVCNNIENMVNGHLAFITANNGNPTFRPYLDRLISLRAIIKDQAEKSCDDMQQKLFI